MVPFQGVAGLALNGDGDPVCSGTITSGYTYIATGCSPSPCTPVYAPFLSTYDITYPTSYEGEDVPAGAGDSDSDGLTLAQEMTQGTSDAMDDTDGDGVGTTSTTESDFIESIWNVNRDSVFCDTTSTPYECTYPDPTTKDLYVEIDWMDNGTTAYKPTPAQLSLVATMFSNHGIIPHFDTGDFGGGKQLITYTETLRHNPTSGQIDFLDYMNGGDGITRSFASNRESIWRYMISGYNYYEDSGSSGWAATMGSALFISTGLINDMNGLANTDRAIANTIAHELGHSICLSNEKLFEEQPDECVYAGIDNKDGTSAYYNLEDYESVMNYRYQLTDDDDMGFVNYSNGTNGTDDHNDWAGIILGMGGFSGDHTLASAGASGLSKMTQHMSDLTKRYSIWPDGSVIVEE